MRKPVFVRKLTEVEHQSLIAGLRDRQAFTIRRCQMLLASARGELVPHIAEILGCDDQTVRNAIAAFNTYGLAALRPGSRRPKNVEPVFSATQVEQLKALLHRSPREFGKDTSVWTLSLAAEISFAEGLTPRQVSGECIRFTLQRLGLSWQRVKQWITSPDPANERKKTPVTA
jgi:transposase